VLQNIQKDTNKKINKEEQEDKSSYWSDLFVEDYRRHDKESDLTSSLLQRIDQGSSILRANWNDSVRLGRIVRPVNPSNH